MDERADRRAVGGLLLASAVLGGSMYPVLGSAFGWPAVLDEPAAVVLPAFSAAETTITSAFWVMLVSSVVLVPAAVGLARVLGRTGWVATSVVTVGVVGAVVQTLGWVRWPVVVPSLAAAWSGAGDEAQRAAVGVTFDTLNLYAGGALGEHLGWLFQALWAVGVGVWVLRANRWFGAVGLVLALCWGLLVVGAVPLRYTETVLETVGLSVYSAWYVWLGALGLWLLLSRRPLVRAGHPGAAGRPEDPRAVATTERAAAGSRR